LREEKLEWAARSPSLVVFAILSLFAENDKAD